MTIAFRSTFWCSLGENDRDRSRSARGWIQIWLRLQPARRVHRRDPQPQEHRQDPAGTGRPVEQRTSIRHVHDPD